MRNIVKSILDAIRKDVGVDGDATRLIDALLHEALEPSASTLEAVEL